jgi:hypothetical protein
VPARSRRQKSSSSTTSATRHRIAWLSERLAAGAALTARIRPISLVSLSAARVAAHAGGEEARRPPAARPAVHCSFAPGAVAPAARIASLHHAYWGHAGVLATSGQKRACRCPACRGFYWADASPAHPLLRGSLRLLGSCGSGAMLSFVARANEPGFVGEHDRLYAVAEIELLQQVVDVGLDRRVGDEQLLSDLCV